MDTVCRGLDAGFVYIDDILVTSPNGASHKLHLIQLFEQLQEHSLAINVPKFQFGCSSIDFRGHYVTQKGARAFADKVEAVATFRQTAAVKGLHRFVGMVNFYRQFIPSAARIMAPFFCVIRKSQ